MKNNTKIVIVILVLAFLISIDYKQIKNSLFYQQLSLKPEQAEQFLKDVTGKRIILDYWEKGEYIIPTGKWHDKSDTNTYYWEFEGINENNEIDWHPIYEGFSKDKYGHSWEYFEDFERYEE